MISLNIILCDIQLCKGRVDDMSVASIFPLFRRKVLFWSKATTWMKEDQMKMTRCCK